MTTKFEWNERQMRTLYKRHHQASIMSAIPSARPLLFTAFFLRTSFDAARIPRGDGWGCWPSWPTDLSDVWTTGLLPLLPPLFAPAQVESQRTNPMAEGLIRTKDLVVTGTRVLLFKTLLQPPIPSLPLSPPWASGTHLCFALCFLANRTSRGFALMYVAVRADDWAALNEEIGALCRKKREQA